MKCHEVPANPKPADLAEILAKFNLDQEIGNQAQVVDLAQFVDLVGGIVAQLASGSNLSTSKDRDALCNLSDKHLGNLLWGPWDILYRGGCRTRRTQPNATPL